MIINGNCLDVMKTFPDNHFTTIITDSPYGISFMSKDWDKQIPPIEYWKEMLRITKPGGHLCCAGLPRMIHRLGCIVEDSGWQIRDLIMHLFGSGFPKSHNNFGFPGYGTALKPAWEGWVLAMKPLDGTFANNAETWGVGGINIEKSRIGSQERTYSGATKLMEERPWNDNQLEKPIFKAQGRWPANLILDEESAEQLDQMTGILKSSDHVRHNNGKDSGILGQLNPVNSSGFKDSGGASRFFYCAKASSKERNAGLEKNNHPTVKPLALMKYLITLLAPPENALCLDPFAGSGSTLVAAKELGIDCVGIELSKEYCEIAQRRVDACKLQPKQLEFNYGS